jgi:hypothetical protein
MKLTTTILKQIIKEELKSLLEEGIKYTSKFSPDGAAIYYVDVDEQGEDRSDYNKGQEQISKAKTDRGLSQAVPFGSEEYKKLKNYYISQGFEFDAAGGMSEKVKPPGQDEYVDFIFRYVKKGE